MTIEDKIKEYDSRFGRLGGVCSNGSLYFSLFSESVAVTRGVTECGLGNLLAAVKAGDVDRVCAIRDHLKPQFDLWFEYYRFVKNSKLVFGFSYITSDRLYANDRPCFTSEGIAVIPFWYYCFGEKEIITKRSGDDDATLTKKVAAQILFAARLLDHCLVRALKHPRHKIVKS